MHPCGGGGKGEGMPRLQLVRIWLCQPRPHSLPHALSQRHAAPRLKLGRVRGACAHRGGRQSGSGGAQGGDVSARVRSAVSASESATHCWRSLCLPPLSHTHIRRISRSVGLPSMQQRRMGAAQARGDLCVCRRGRACVPFLAGERPSASPRGEGAKTLSSSASTSSYTCRLAECLGVHAASSCARTCARQPPRDRLNSSDRTGAQSSMRDD